MLQIGFCLYRGSDPAKRLEASHLMYNYDCGTSGPYINYREVFARCDLCLFFVKVNSNFVDHLFPSVLQ